MKHGKSGGFTILEVMIVLAIAGLMLSIIFLVVPAVRRQNNNTALVNDAHGLLEGVNTHINSNAGAMPTGVSNVAAHAIDVGRPPATPVSVTLSYVAGGSVTLTTMIGSAVAPPVGQIKIYLYAVCKPGIAGEAVADAKTNRHYVALFTLEGGAKRCLQN